MNQKQLERNERWKKNVGHVSRSCLLLPLTSVSTSHLWQQPSQHWRPGMFRFNLPRAVAVETPLQVCRLDLDPARPWRRTGSPAVCADDRDSPKWLGKDLKRDDLLLRILNGRSAARRVVCSRKMGTSPNKISICIFLVFGRCSNILRGKEEWDTQKSFNR